MKTTSTGQYTYVSLKPDVYTPVQQSLTQPPIFLPLTGQLPGGRYLSYPILVKIEEDDGEFIVSEIKFYMHGEGETTQEAIEAFKRTLSQHLDILSEEENNLSPYLCQQLGFLRQIIKVE